MRVSVLNDIRNLDLCLNDLVGMGNARGGIMDLKNIGTKISTLQTKVELPEAPILDIPAGAGVAGNRRVLVQVMTHFWNGRVTGASANIKRGSAHRFGVARIIDLDQLDDNAETWLRKALGPQSEDQEFRTQGRHDLIMEFINVEMKDTRPWTQSYKGITNAIKWCVDACMRNKTKQYALLMVCDITEFETVVPDNERFAPYQEAKITAVLHVECCELSKTESEDMLDIAGLDSDVAHLV